MKKLKELLEPHLKLSFFFFHHFMALFVYLIEGEWLYFVPLIIGDICLKQSVGNSGKKRKKKKKKAKLKVGLMQFICSNSCYYSERF